MTKISRQLSWIKMQMLYRLLKERKGKERKVWWLHQRKRQSLTKQQISSQTCNPRQSHSRPQAPEQVSDILRVSAHWQQYKAACVAWVWFYLRGMASWTGSMLREVIWILRTLSLLLCQDTHTCTQTHTSRNTRHRRAGDTWSSYTALI